MQRKWELNDRDTIVNFWTTTCLFLAPLPVGFDVEVSEEDEEHDGDEAHPAHQDGRHLALHEHQLQVWAV